MDELISFLTSNSQMLWLLLGVVLLCGEMILPGVFLLWLGIAAMATGLVSWALPDIGFVGEGLIFSSLAASLIYVARRFFYGKGGAPVDNRLNARGRSLIGQQFRVVEPIVAGRGKLQVGDSQWIAHGPDMEAGAFAKVVDAEGVILVVEPVSDPGEEE